jgi:hypothetical protein
MAMVNLRHRTYDESLRQTVIESAYGYYTEVLLY